MPKTKSVAVPTKETIAEAAERWNVSQDWIRKRIADGSLRMFRNSRVIRLDPHDVDNLFTAYGDDVA
ncbi:MAG: hypothetical protein LKI24_14205 [Acidipropionibacterium sp.]|jgi:excisionase family DNA binding protein|nr:hypothetical protein [Acidipropionibacterium sp.]